MSSLFSRRDKVDVPPVRAPREGGRTRMAGERPSRTRRRSEERRRSIEEALEKRRRGRRSRRRGEEERSRSRSRGLVGGRRKNPKPPKDKGSEVVLDTFMGTGGRRSDPRPPRPEGGSGPRRDPGRGGRTGGRRDEGKMVDSRGGRRSDPRREKVYHPIVKSKTPKDQRLTKEDRGPKSTADSSALIGRSLGTTSTGKRDGDPRPPRPEGGRGGRTGGRRSDPRPDRDRNRGRSRVRDEAFRRRRRGGSPRRISREERRRRVRVANTRK
tara:strand:+ start:67 stop:873 length:807 start_codon:yes stop_codon:yes gene_type:complete